MATQAITDFEASLRGKLIQPGNNDYNSARKVYNAMIDKHPALIVQCADIADVINSVNYARDNNLLLAIRGGGHNGGGLGICDNGLVIDLSLKNGIHIDSQAKTALVQGGCLLKNVDHATHIFEDRVKVTYGDNYERLVQIKTKYDPQNLFRVNQNIKPAHQEVHFA